jgi:adenosylcobinamide-GDP ribazoletransferase
VRDLAAAVTFLTRLRLRSPVRGAADLAPAVPWFPVAGGLIGLAVGAVHVGAAALMPPLIAAAIAVTAGLLLTGALHEDGLADTADGIGGGWSAEERLEIMRDPSHGTYGVLALVASVGVRTVALSFLGGWGAVAGLMAAHALSRSATGVLLAVVPPATEKGLGAAYGRLVTGPRALAGAAAGGAIAAVALGFFSVPAAGLAAVGAASVGLMAFRALGGITGDVLGAAQQVSEALILVMVTAFSWNGMLSIPWW